MAKRNESEATKAVFRQYIGIADKPPSRYKKPTKQGVEAGKLRRQIEERNEQKALDKIISGEWDYV